MDLEYYANHFSAAANLFIMQLPKLRVHTTDTNISILYRSEYIFVFYTIQMKKLADRRENGIRFNEEANS